MPTRKWLAARVVAAGALAVLLFTGDSAISDEETIAIIGFAVEGIVSYLVPNQATDTGDGVPA